MRRLEESLIRVLQALRSKPVLASLLALVVGIFVTPSLWAQAAPAVEADPAEAKAEADPAAATEDAEPKLGQDWVRVARGEDDEAKSMQVAIVTYRGQLKGRPVEVDLVGAVHVGDASYYDALNKRFEQYDALLYELVAPEGTVIDPAKVDESRSVVGSLQGGMKSVLELDHQLEKIDYTRANFVHADMTPEQFSQSMEDRGESFLQMFFRMMGQGIAIQSKQAAEGQSTDVDMIRAMFAPDRARRLKIVFAEQMADVESMLGGFGGAAGSTLITERNKIAFDVLRRELDAGKSRLGVFYGAGHLPDMDERLRKDFGLEPKQITWLDAWDLTAQ